MHRIAKGARKALLGGYLLVLRLLDPVFAGKRCGKRDAGPTLVHLQPWPDPHNSRLRCVRILEVEHEDFVAVLDEKACRAVQLPRKAREFRLGGLDQLGLVQRAASQVEDLGAKE